MAKRVQRLYPEAAERVKKAQRARQLAAELLIEQGEARLAAIDPDLPRDVQIAKMTRIRAEVREKVRGLLLEMQPDAALAEAQRAHYVRAALLRRAGTEAPPKYHALCAHVADGVLAQLAEDALADNDRALAGTVALAAAGRRLAPEVQTAIAEALGGLPFPEVKELNDRYLQPIRDAYLDVGIALARFAPPPGGGAEEMLPYARERGKPVLPDA